MSTAKPGSRNRSSVDRPADDFYPTPESAVVPFVEDCFHMLGPKVWEPACGDGRMSKVLQAFGKEVISTNLIDRGYGESGVDFLETTELRAPTIITNPPASHATEFVEHAVNDLNAPVAAFFLRLKFLESTGRFERLFKNTRPAYVLVFTGRIKFFSGDTPLKDQPGWSSEAFAWFVWVRSHRAHWGQTKLSWLHRADDWRERLP